MTEKTVESVAKALLINPANQALVLTIGAHKERPEKSYKPDLPGGLVDPGETEQQAVVREIYEETEIVIEPDQLRMVYSETKYSAAEEKSVSKHLFIGVMPGDTPVTLSWEHSAYEWIPVAELSQVQLRSFYDTAIQYCISHGIISH